MAALKFASALPFLYGTGAVAEGEENYLEFDNRMLWGAPENKASADLSRFSHGNPMPVGNMKVDLYLNGVFLGAADINFAPAGTEQLPVACFTPKDLMPAGLAVKKLPRQVALWMDGRLEHPACKRLAEVIPGSTATFDFSEQTLSLSIAQAFLLERLADYIDPQHWEKGITAGRLNYAVDLISVRGGGYASTQGFAHLESGFNALGWRLRNIATLASDREQGALHVRRTYLQTDISALTSSLTLGQSYSDGLLFDSYGLQGAVLATDTRMLPASLRNYSPVVKGVADTNARVTIRQNNVVVDERLVPPGAFEVSNLAGLGFGNDLDVTVAEADGTAKKFSVPYSPPPQLLRPDFSTYAISVGQGWSESYGHYRPRVGQLNYQRGLNNHLTLSGGALASDAYTARGLGSAVSTYFGGLSLGYVHSTSRFGRGAEADGESVRLTYSTLLAPSNTYLTLSSTLNSSSGFLSFNEFLASRNQRVGEADVAYWYGSRQKGRFTISLRQRLAVDYGSVLLNASTREFWNRKGSSRQYQASYSNRYNALTYDVSANRTQTLGNNHHGEFRLSFSLPLASSRYGRNYLSARAWKQSERGSVAQVQAGGVAGAEQQLSYAVSTTQALDDSAALQNVDLNGGYQGSRGYLSAGLSKGSDYQQSSVGVAGSVLAHADGFTLGQTLGDTVALVQARDGQGARITNSAGAQLDSAGYGVVSHLAPYARNRIEVDPEGLSPELQFGDTGVEVIPVAGSIVRVELATSKESVFYVSGTFEDGSPLPFGAEVIDVASQNHIGYVGQAGRISARGVSEQSQLEVRFKDGRCRTQPPVAVDDAADNAAGNVEGVGVICTLI